MALALIGDDKPFLVDSTSAAITAAGLEIDRLLHPVIDVRRDKDGKLLEVVGLATGEPAPGTIRESMIFVELERDRRQGPRRAGAPAWNASWPMSPLAVADWQPMLAALRAATRALESNPPPVAPHRAAEAAAFLEWLADDNFTLLGVRRYDLSGDLDDPDMQPVSTEGLGLLRDPDYPVWTGTPGPSGHAARAEGAAGDARAAADHQGRRRRHRPPPRQCRPRVGQGLRPAGPRHQRNPLPRPLHLRSAGHVAAPGAAAAPQGRRSRRRHRFRPVGPQRQDADAPARSLPARGTRRSQRRGAEGHVARPAVGARPAAAQAVRPARSVRPLPLRPRLRAARQSTPAMCASASARC